MSTTEKKRQAGTERNRQRRSSANYNDVAKRGRIRGRGRGKGQGQGQGQAQGQGQERAGSRQAVTSIAAGAASDKFLVVDSLVGSGSDSATNAAVTAACVAAGAD